MRATSLVCLMALGATSCGRQEPATAPASTDPALAKFESEVLQSKLPVLVDFSTPG